MLRNIESMPGGLNALSSAMADLDPLDEPPAPAPPAVGSTAAPSSTATPAAPANPFASLFGSGSTSGGSAPFPQPPLPAGLGMGMGMGMGMPDAGAMQQMLSDPGTREMMAAMMRNPATRQLLTAQAAAQGLPAEVADSLFSNPDALLQSMQMMQHMFPQGLPAGGAAPASSTEPPAVRFRGEIQQLKDMGFYDEAENARGAEPFFPSNPCLYGRGTLT